MGRAVYLSPNRYQNTLCYFCAKEEKKSNWVPFLGLVFFAWRILSLRRIKFVLYIFKAGRKYNESALSTFLEICARKPKVPGTRLRVQLVFI